MDAELVRLDWPKPQVPTFKQKKFTRGLGGAILSNRNDQYKEFIPFHNASAAQIQAEQIREIRTPAPPKVEKEQNEIPTPKQEIEQKEIEALDKAEENSPNIKLHREKKLRTIFDA